MPAVEILGQMASFEFVCLALGDSSLLGYDSLVTDAGHTRDRRDIASQTFVFFLAGFPSREPQQNIRLPYHTRRNHSEQIVEGSCP